MIKSFKCRETKRIFGGRFSRQLLRDVQGLAARKIEVIAAAGNLEPLRVPPSTRLEKLKGDRSEQHSIPINDQWRICFVWKDGDALDIEIVDYH